MKYTNLRFVIRSAFPEGLGKGVMVNLELGDPVILVGSHSNKGALHQLVGEDRLLVLLGDESGDHHPGLVLVHGVECDDLEKERAGVCCVKGSNKY